MCIIPHEHSMLLGIALGSVWVFHGLYSKMLGGIPRHRAIVARVVSERHAGVATVVIGLLEVSLGLWVCSGYERVACAAVQTVAIVTMNTLEIWLARDLLNSPWGMVALNCGFVALVWYSALFISGA